MTKALKPQIRFKGFTDPWEQRKWADSITISTNMVDPRKAEFAKLPHVAPGNIESFTGCLYDNVRTVKDEKLISGKFRFYKGDIIYGKINPQLGKYYFAEFEGLTSADAYVLNTKNKLNQEFLFSLIQTENFYKYTVSVSRRSGMPKINRDELNSFTFLAGSHSEQYKIGKLFMLINNLITLHQRKCDLLKNVKKSMLEKMFPQIGTNVPEIRFKGFTDPWEQRKLVELVERVTRKNQDLVSTLPLTISAQYGLIDQNEFFDKRIASKDVSGYFLINSGEFAYNKSTSNDAPWGAIKRLDRYKNGVLSTLYIVFKILDVNRTNSNFLVAYYSTELWYKGIREIAAEGARNHGLLNIMPQDFFETNIMLPQGIEEQKIIGMYFQQLNNLITLHQRKLGKLKKIKKAMLEKMFI